MIQYHRSPFGLNLLLRVNGSAVYRATIPGLFSVVFVILIRTFWTSDMSTVQNEEVIHPYAIGALLGGITFLLVFRLQQGYARYWEAASAVHHMMSKWMDAVIHTAAYHMQNSHYDKIKPPSYFDYHELDACFLTRERERKFAVEDTNEAESVRVYKRSVCKSIETVDRQSGETSLRRTRSGNVLRNSCDNASSQGSGSSSGGGQPYPLEGPPRLDGNWGRLFKDKKATFFDPKNPKRRDPAGFASHQGGHTAPLFLQELSHIASLLNGVALSTLRNDVEGSESPLDIYNPGAPWPEVDPTNKRNEVFRNEFSCWDYALNFLGVGRSPEARTRYNATRPLPVLGGVSDAEIRFLQMSRGPYAKTELCQYWAVELITREHLAGTTGTVGPPIISRIMQFLSDGMAYYNHARKIMFIPFPFPHAQLSVVYVLISIPVIGFLMDQYCSELWLACVLSFLTETVFSGMHEVARELENPFRNIPNELPLVTLQAQFNEALIVMFSGYHPDGFWSEDASRLRPMPATVLEEVTPCSSDDSSPRSDVRVQEGEKQDQNTMEAKMKKLINKVEQQAQELEHLRARLVTGKELP